jgi:hypothetical protein
MFGIDDAIAAGLKIVDKFIPDQQAKIEAEKALRADLMTWDKGQMAVNAAEATHSSIFVAGWRPAIGWTCAAALAYQYVITPLAMWGSQVTGHPLPLPAIRIDEQLWELTTAMLGMGGLRTFEKLKGVAK